MTRTGGLCHDEIVLPEFLVEAVSDVIAAYTVEFNMDASDPKYLRLIEFADDVAQAVLAALLAKSRE